jgi:hypothetical protein
MPNRWVEHVKEFARKNNISYGCALSDPNLKRGYIPIGDKRRKPEKLEMAVPDTSVKPKGIVIKPHEVIPLQQAFPDTEVKAKKITIKPRPLAATLGEFDLLRKLLLRPNGVGTAMLLQKGLLLAKEQWIDGKKDKNSVLTILELTKKQQTHLKSNGETSKSGAYISVDAVEANRKEVDDLLAAITGKMGGLEFYHGGGVGSPHAFRMRLRGTGGIKEKRELLVGVAKWLEKVPSVAAIRELYDKEFSGQRAEMKASEAAARKDSRVSGATEWLGHPLTEIDYKDVVRSLKALIKKHKFKYNGIQTLLKETDGNSAELISRVYKTLSGLQDRSRWDPVLEDFRKSLLAKGFWVENVKRLPADVGAYIGSFLNLPKSVTDQLAARRTGKAPPKTKAPPKPKKKPKRKLKDGLKLKDILDSVGHSYEDSRGEEVYYPSELLYDFLKDWLSGGDGDYIISDEDERQAIIYDWTEMNGAGYRGGAKKKPVKAEPVKLKSGAPKMPTFLDPDTAWNRFAKEYHNPTHGPKVRDRVIERAPNPQTSTRTDTIPVAESKTASTMGAGYRGSSLVQGNPYAMFGA